MRATTLALVLVVSVATGCGPGAADTTAVAAPTPTASAAPTVDSTAAILPSVTATTPIALAAVFLAVVEEAVDGTELAAFVDDEPESVLAIGQAFCELRDTGRTDEEILTAYLEAVGSQQELTEVDATFAGVVFGAAGETLCPTTE